MRAIQSLKVYCSDITCGDELWTSTGPVPIKSRRHRRMSYVGSRRVGLASLALRSVFDPGTSVEMGTYHIYSCPVCGSEAVYLDRHGIKRRVDNIPANKNISIRDRENEAGARANEPKPQSEDLLFRQDEETESDVTAINQVYGIEQSTKQANSSLSESRVASYLLASSAAGFILLRALTSQEMIVALGTLSIAIIGMWVLALLSKARALTQSLTTSKGDLPEV